MIHISVAGKVRTASPRSATPMKTPVALFLFNRPELTRRVFDAIAAARPRQLFLVADGPRDQTERHRCDAARAVTECIDWPCEVRRDFADANLGCRRRMAGGIDWVFAQVERAILLEDDCVPDPSFFPFCEQLLDRYALDERVMMISGDNFQFGVSRTDASYYFSKITHVWGWGTWRRAWRHYDVTMRDWPAVRDSPWLEAHLGDRAVAAVFRRIFDNVHAGRVDTWDSQWTYAVWRQGGLTALPSGNLVTNVGFGADATHTKADQSIYSRLPTVPMRFPLRHPEEVEPHAEADAFSLRQLVGSKSV